MNLAVNHSPTCKSYRSVAGSEDVFIGRIRADASHLNGLVMWVVADNLRKGAALNAVQIAEEAVRRGWL